MIGKHEPLVKRAETQLSDYSFQSMSFTPTHGLRENERSISVGKKEEEEEAIGSTAKMLELRKHGKLGQSSQFAKQRTRNMPCPPLPNHTAD